jgi:hypothetical protein
MNRTGSADNLLAIDRRQNTPGQVSPQNLVTGKRINANWQVPVPLDAGQNNVTVERIQTAPNDRRYGSPENTLSSDTVMNWKQIRASQFALSPTTWSRQPPVTAHDEDDDEFPPPPDTLKFAFSDTKQSEVTVYESLPPPQALPKLTPAAARHSSPHRDDTSGDMRGAADKMLKNFQQNKHGNNTNTSQDSDSSAGVKPLDSNNKPVNVGPRPIRLPPGQQTGQQAIQKQSEEMDLAAFLADKARRRQQLTS